MESGGSPLIGIIVYVVILVVNSLLHAFYSAVDNSNESFVEELAEEGNRSARILLRYFDSGFLLVDSLHFLSGLGYVIVGGYCLPQIYAGLESALPDAWYIFPIIGAVCFLLLLFFHYAAVKIGGVKEERVALRLCWFAHLWITIVKPLVNGLKILSKGVVLIFGVDPNKNLDEVSEDEIISMVNEGHEQGLIESSEAEMIHNIFEFTDKDARDIMTHRKNMIMLSGESTFKEALDFMLENTFSRYPVYVEDSDNIIGVVHIRDFMERMQDASVFDTQLQQLDGLIREASFIPETRNINDLFHTMQEEKNHLVIVVDEYGQTSGLVTMEDILEEIVGNIFDEYDEEELSITSIEDGSYVIGGMTSLEEVAEILDVELPVDDYDTLNGYLISLIDRIPSEEEQIQIVADGYLFEVQSIENKMIQSVHVTKCEEEAEEEL